MAYGVKYRISYCNKENVTARLDIEVRDYVGATENVVGTTDLFKIGHKNENDNKTGYIISTFADINLYEHPITIDNLKTLDETAIRISYYIAGILRWQGFALPDFFETEITKNAIISISATDRLSTLKDKALSSDNISTDPNTSIIKLISECLKLTGLELNINIAPFFDYQRRPSAESIFEYIYINKQRLSNTKGRSVSAYDVLKSILIDFNCYIVQRNNEWWIVNKFAIENDGAKSHKYNASGNSIGVTTNYVPAIKDINLISLGGRRTIQPSAFEVSIYGEYGGLPLYPYNYDFDKYISGAFDGWTSKGFVEPIQINNTDNILSYDNDGSAILGTETIPSSLRYRAPVTQLASMFPHLSRIESKWIPLGSIAQASINLSINATLRNGNALGVTAIIHDSDGNYRTLLGDKATWFKHPNLDTAQGRAYFTEFSDEDKDSNSAIHASASISLPVFDVSLLDSDDATNLDGCSVQFWLMGSINDSDIFIHSAILSIDANINDKPKGTISKVQQVADFSKKYDTPTTIFSDYVRSGINGYFYKYPINDTSVFMLSNGTNTSDAWVDSSVSINNDYLILQATRQMSRLFSSARDVLTIEIDSNDFDILDVYKCGDKRFTATSLSFDFFKSKLSLTLEENVISNTTKRDFLYSYFGGDSDDGISGIGGIGGSGSSGGGGSSSPQYWQLDENGNLFTEYNAYSLQGLSAFGLGEGGGGSGGGMDRLDTWASYDASKSGWVLSAFLGKDLDTRTAKNSYDIGALNQRVDTIEGVDSDKNYIHTQSAPSDNWTINHTLNKYPSVTIIDSGGTEVIGNIKYIDTSTVLVTFTSGFSGKAILN